MYYWDIKKYRCENLKKMDIMVRSMEVNHLSVKRGVYYYNRL